MNRLFRTLLGFALWTVLSLFCQSALALSPEDQPAFETGKTLFEAKDYASAFEIFTELFEKNPEDPDINFMLGRSAFQLGLLEDALMVYDRMLILLPDAHRVRLEMARTFLGLGAFESAKYHFQKVLATEPPLMVKKRIEDYLRAIEKATQRHTLSGELKLFAGWDDNPVATPRDETIAIPAINNIRVTMNKKEEDHFYGEYIRLSHFWRAKNPKIAYHTSFTNYSLFYDTESSKTLSLTSMDTGPSFSSGNTSFKPQIGFTHMDRHHTTYLNSARLSFIFNQKPTPATQIHAVLSAEYRDFKDDTRDARDVALDITPFVGRKRVGFGCRLRYENENAENDEFDLNRIEAEPQVTVLFSKGWLFRLKGTYAWSRYSARSHLFLKRRTDHLVAFTTAVSRQIWQSRQTSKRLSVGLDYRWTRTTSTIELYEYTQNWVQLSGSWTF
ncbi:MAG: tetratricopeptide repeat protein [Desulfobacterales bacterium]|nr:tetratricopeptide repeat protein [Desulfobacterales bacterium]